MKIDKKQIRKIIKEAVSSMSAADYEFENHDVAMKMGDARAAAWKAMNALITAGADMQTAKEGVLLTVEVELDNYKPSRTFGRER